MINNNLNNQKQSKIRGRLGIFLSKQSKGVVPDMTLFPAAAGKKKSAPAGCTFWAGF